jgi:hypothetical protein
MYALEEMNRTQMESAILENDIDIDLDVALNMTDEEMYDFLYNWIVSEPDTVYFE